LSRVNRIAVHQSIVHPLDPVGLVQVAERADIDSVGLHVASVEEVEPWWVKGIGSEMLRELVSALLASRVTVLDVGRVRLGPELRVWDGRHAYARALELGVRLGAQFVTARAAADVNEDPAELFAVLDELAARYRLRPLLAVVPGTPAATLATAAAIVDGTRGGIVLDVSPHNSSPTDVEEAVVELGEKLGYVRVPARELDTDLTPGLLATLPPQVPVAIGDSASAPVTDAQPGADPLTRLTAWRAAVDVLLRHPQASH
jgi:sugar phosphate isomerase/epimerase